MVRALPEKKAHSDKKKGTEPRNSKNKVKKNPGILIPHQPGKNILRNFRAGFYPKTENLCQTM
jgi:hypothetical protein